MEMGLNEETVIQLKIKYILPLNQQKEEINTLYKKFKMNYNELMDYGNRKVSEFYSLIDNRKNLEYELYRINNFYVSLHNELLKKIQELGFESIPEYILVLKKNEKADIDFLEFEDNKENYKRIVQDILAFDINTKNYVRDISELNFNIEKFKRNYKLKNTIDAIDSEFFNKLIKILDDEDRSINEKKYIIENDVISQLTKKKLSEVFERLNLD